MFDHMKHAAFPSHHSWRIRGCQSRSSRHGDQARDELLAHTGRLAAVCPGVTEPLAPKTAHRVGDIGAYLHPRIPHRHCRREFGGVRWSS